MVDKKEPAIDFEAEAEKLRDKDVRQEFVRGTSLLMMVKLAAEMKVTSGKQFLDAAKLWERLTVSAATESRKKKPKAKGSED